MGRRLCRVSIVGILLGTALACSAERPPEPEPDEASNRSGGCTEKRAIESARRVTAAGTPQGVDITPLLGR